MSVNSVYRIHAPAPEVFYRDYVLAQRPMIFTNLFDESPLRRIDTPESASTALGDVPLEVRSNYMVGYLGVAPPLGPHTISLGAYLNLIRANPETLDVCAEHPTPQAILEQLVLNSYRHIHDETDLHSNMFVAGRSNYAHLHYDADQRDVLLYQVFGMKRIVVIHPRETQKLDALDREDLCRTSAVLLENASQLEQAAFLQYTSAYDALLRPGETMFIPAMAWHYIEYLTPAMSIAYRLGRNPYTRRLAALFPNPSVDVQALAVLLLDEAAAAAHHNAWLQELEQTYRSLLPNDQQRSDLMRRLCLSIRAKHTALEPVLSIREWDRRQALVFQAPGLAENSEPNGSGTTRND